MRKKWTADLRRTAENGGGDVDVKLPIHVNKKSEMNSKEVATTWRQRRRLMTMRDKCTENLQKALHIAFQYV